MTTTAIKWTSFRVPNPDALKIAPFVIIFFVSSAYDIRMSSEGSLFIVPVMFGAMLSEVSQMVAAAVTERLFRRNEEA
jgi:hypothetical protein